MSATDENPIHVAIRALEHAMRTSHEHQHRLAEHAHASRPVPPVEPAVPAAAGQGSGGGA